MISKDYKYRYIKTDAGQNVLNRKVLYVYAQFDQKKNSYSAGETRF